MVPQEDIICHRVEPPVLGVRRLHLVESLVKGVPWCLWNITTVANAIDYFPQPEGKALLLATTLMSLNMRESNWCPTESFAPTDQCSSYWKMLCKLSEEEKGNH